MSRQREGHTGSPRVHQSRWSLWKAFAVGAVIGAIIGVVWGWIDYGALEIGYLSNHVLGGLFLFGFLSLALAAILNWRRRNPL